MIPAFNEQDRLPQTLQLIDAFLSKERHRSLGTVELLVVDDGSSDETAEAAARSSQRYSAVRVLRNPGNRGKGYSVRHGMLEAQGEWILFTDADLSAPIEELDKLFDAVERQQVEVAIGSRALNRSLIGRRQSWLRENAGRLFNLLMRLATGLPFWDTQCGFKLFRRDAAKAVFSRQTIDGFGFDVEALFLARKFGYRIAEVPVRWNHAEGTKVNLFSDSLRMFTDLLLVRWNDITGKYSRPLAQRFGPARMR